MNYKIINSGSDGNAVLINGEILIDCGVSYKKISDYTKKLKIVLLTHIHCDHFNESTISMLAIKRPGLRFACGEWLKDKLIACGVAQKNIDILTFEQLYDYGLFKLSIFELFHDVPQCGYKIFANGKKLIYATDTKTLDGVEAKDYDIYLIEANYENEEELMGRAVTSDYAERVKNTHLSKEYAVDWLIKNMSDSSIFEFMHQHKEKHIARRFMYIEPILEEVSQITSKDYALDDNSIQQAMSDLLNEYNKLKEYYGSQR